MTDILALDFDGVLCNSAGETGTTGWKGAAQLWPNRFTGMPSDEILEAFRLVRPVLETGYESILLIRLLRDGHSVDEILADSPSLTSRLLLDESLDKNDLLQLFGSTRDTWMSTDLQGWLNTHRFYDGTVDAINQSPCDSYIITTKEKRFAAALCRSAGLQISEERIFGLESGKKAQVLAGLSRQHENACFHFVEDRLLTLTKTAGSVDFDLRIYLADWGYNTAEERDSAAKTPTIHVLTQAEFAKFALAPGAFAV